MTIPWSEMQRWQFTPWSSTSGEPAPWTIPGAAALPNPNQKPTISIPRNPAHFDKTGQPYGTQSFIRGTSFTPFGSTTVSQNFQPGMGPGQTLPEYADPAVWSSGGPMWQPFPGRYIFGGPGSREWANEINTAAREAGMGAAVPDRVLPGGVPFQRFKPLVPNDTQFFEDQRKANPDRYEPDDIPIVEVTPEEILSQMGIEPIADTQIGVTGNVTPAGQPAAPQTGGGGKPFASDKWGGRPALSPSPASFGTPPGQRTAAQTEQTEKIDAELFSELDFGGSNKTQKKILIEDPIGSGQYYYKWLELNAKTGNWEPMQIPLQDARNPNPPAKPPNPNYSHVSRTDGSILIYDDLTGEYNIVPAPASPMEDKGWSYIMPDGTLRKDLTKTQYSQLEVLDKQRQSLEEKKIRAAKTAQEQRQWAMEYARDINRDAYNREQTRKSNLRAERQDFMSSLAAANAQGVTSFGQGVQAQQVRNTAESNAIALAIEQRKLALEEAQTPFRNMASQPQARFAPFRR